MYSSETLKPGTQFESILLITGKDGGTKTSSPNTRSPNNADKSTTSELKNL